MRWIVPFVKVTVVIQDATSINSGDIFTQMRIALQWARGNDHARIHLNKLTPPFKNKYSTAEAFRLGTLGGAEALNIAHLIGTVEVGKRADLHMLDAPAAIHLAYRPGMPLTHAVWRAGQRLV